MTKLMVFGALFAASVALGASAEASCRIHNDTSWSFKIESGNVSNQSVGSHTHTTIAAGPIKGKDDKSGKTISGSCKDGESLVIKDDHGIPVLQQK